MLKSFIHKIQKEYSFKELLFLVCMIVCGFALAAEAAITKSVSTSFFIGRYGASFFPYAWLISMPINICLVAFYSRTIRSLGCILMMGIAIGITILLYIICALRIKDSASLPFILYISKEVFVMFMFHNLWSVIHASVSFDKAKYLYGIIFGIGGLGSVFGGAISKLYASEIGSENLLLLTIPLYAVTFIAYYNGVRIQGQLPSSQNIVFTEKNTGALYGFGLVKSSKVLSCILIFVVSMQLTSTMIEYQFNIQLGQLITSIDARTAYLGGVLSLINIVNVCMHFLGCFLLVNLLGLLSVHILVPSILLFNLLLYYIFPSFFLLTANYGVVKIMDYSIFGIVTGMLYAPLSVEEKFQGRSVINVFAHRGAKSIVSLVALSASWIGGSFLALSFFIFSNWIYYAYVLKKYFAGKKLGFPAIKI
jgi:ATP/ADP translocase